MNRFQRVSDLFERVRRLPPDQREAKLLEACGDDPDLLAEVRGLLEHHEDECGLFDEPVLGHEESGNAAVEGRDGIPARIGKYRIVRRIGQGGMGVVFLAEQDNPRRHVALKLLRPGYVNRDLLKRFELESAMLGRLQHPGIAQIYEAGTYETPTAELPYFVMEMVEGVTLLEYVSNGDLALRRRLELVAQVCDAIEHAHQRGVIHRDLKPSNILVHKDSPKVLDFGVARATDADLQASTMHTDAGQLIGTVAYMSPEQVQGQAHQVDTRSDVYALGVMLYEMIAGKLPYDLKDRSIVAAAQAIAHDEPDSLTSTNRRYGGDLNTIVQKALEKDPERRYPAAAALASDIRHYLNDEPIVARPATTVYQLQKFARRHRGLVAGLMVALAALVVGFVVASTQAIRATQQRNLAESEARFATRVKDFLYDVLTSAHAARRGADATIQDAIREAADAIDQEPPVDARVAMEIRNAIGAAYESIGMFSDAQIQVEKGVAKATLALGPDDKRLVSAYRLLSLVHFRQGHYDQATEFAAMAKKLEPQHVLVALLQAEIALATGDFEKAEQLTQWCLTPPQVKDMTADDEVQATLILARTLRQLDRVEEEEQLLVDALQSTEQRFGAESSQCQYLKSSLAIIYLNTSRHDQGIPMLREVLANQTKVHVADDPNLAVLRVNLGIGLFDLQRYEEAERELTIAADSLVKKLGDEHPTTLSARSSLGNALLNGGKLDQAADVLRDVLERKVRVLGSDHPQTWISMLNMAMVHRAREEYERAAEWIERALVARRERFGPDDSRTMSAIRLKARNLYERGDYESAEPLYDQFYQWNLNANGAEHVNTVEATQALEVMRAK